MPQLRLFKDPLQISVRTGKGTIVYADVDNQPDFTDQIDLVDRIPRDHSGWKSIRYKTQRYQLFGGIRTAYFICLNSPIVPAPSCY